MSTIFQINPSNTLTSQFGVVAPQPQNKYKEQAEQRRESLLAEAIASGQPYNQSQLVSRVDFIGLRSQCKIAFSRAQRKIYQKQKKNFSVVRISPATGCFARVSKAGKQYVVIPSSSLTNGATELQAALVSWSTGTFVPMLNSVTGNQVQRIAVDFYGLVSADDGSVFVFPESDPSVFQAPAPYLFCDSFTYQFDFNEVSKEYSCNITFHVRFAGLAHVPPALELAPSV